MADKLDDSNLLDCSNLEKAAVIKQIGVDNWDDRMVFERDISSGSFRIKDIKSFVFGGFTSRFWLLRKHINSMDVNGL